MKHAHSPHLFSAAAFGSLIALATGACAPTKASPGSATQSVACPASPAPELFESALCICEDLADVGFLRVDGGVGVNGNVSLINQSELSGDLLVGGEFRATTDTVVDGSLHAASRASFIGALSVGSDLLVGADLEGVGVLDVAGALGVAGETRVEGLSEVGGETDYQASTDMPCPCGEAALDVAGMVEAAALANDNADAGIDSGELGIVGTAQVTLPSGSYYLEGGQSVGRLRLSVDGVVALHIDGSVDTVGLADIELSPGSTLDLYIAGSLRHVGAGAVAADDPTAVRIYVGGSDELSVDMVGELALDGLLYAPSATVRLIGRSEMRGGLVARRLAGVGELFVSGRAPSAELPDSCQEPSTPPSEGDPGGPVIQ